MHCMVCHVEVDRYTSIDVPDRSHESSIVQPMCFACADAMTRAFSSNIWVRIQQRELGKNKHLSTHNDTSACRGTCCRKYLVSKTQLQDSQNEC